MPRFLLKFLLKGRPNKGRPDVESPRARLTFGSRPTADLYVNDRMLSREAAVFTFDGSRLTVDLKEPLAGVFVDGRPVDGHAQIPSGSTVQAGHTLITAEVDPSTETCTLTVAEGYLPAVVDEIVKKAKPEVPFALVDSGTQEERWGKTPHMRRFNVVAFWGGLACLASFFALKNTEAMTRGELASTHMIGNADHGERSMASCEDCHAPFDSHYGKSCGKCHEGMSAAGSDDPSQPYLKHPYQLADEISCARCHSDHRGADAGLVPKVSGPESGFCTECHAAKKPGVDFQPADLRAKLKDAPGEPTPRQLLVDGFSHADHRVRPDKPRTSSVASSAASKGEVPIKCEECHVPVSDAAPRLAEHAEYGAVTYEKCLECHAEWRVEVHGRDEQGKACTVCHAPAADPMQIKADLRDVTLPATELKYVVVPRAHDFSSDQCLECHVLEPMSEGKKTSIAERVFRHDHHLTAVNPALGTELTYSKQCETCHSSVAQSETLAGTPVADLTWTGVNTTGCASCHNEGEIRKVAVPGGATRTVRDIFHRVHTLDAGEAAEGALATRSERNTLARGCVSCHVPVEGADRMGLRQGTGMGGRVLSGEEAINDCLACHSGHENVGQGKCVICHVDRTAGGPNWTGPNKSAFVFRFNEAGIFNREKGTTKTEPVIARFDHGSIGHEDSACDVCHPADSIDPKARVLDVAYPRFDDPSCVECHVQTRYHR